LDLIRINVTYHKTIEALEAIIESATIDSLNPISVTSEVSALLAEVAKIFKAHLETHQ